MKIILEGADNSGKTTLAEHLYKTNPFVYYHHPGGRPKDFEAETECAAQQVGLLRKHRDIVLDRCTGISQQVYSPDQSKSEIRNNWVYELLETEALIVYCRPSTDWLMSFENFTWREGETEEFKKEIIEKQFVFIETYDELFRTIPHIHYDYNSDEAPWILRQLSYSLLEDASAQHFLSELAGYKVKK